MNEAKKISGIFDPKAEISPANLSKHDIIPQAQKVPDIKLGRYRHFKGNEYEVICIASHSETLEPMVVYLALYGEHGVWVRPAAMWNEKVTRNGVTYDRFTYIGD